MTIGGRTKQNHWRKTKGGIGSLAIAGLIILGGSTPAHAAEIMKDLPGQLNCGGTAEQHISSVAKGNVYSSLMDPYGWNNPFGRQMTITTGYSTTYANWDQHFFTIIKSSRGYAYGSTGITSGNRYCI